MKLGKRACGEAPPAASGKGVLAPRVRVVGSAGKLARTWERDGKVTIGYEQGHKRVVLGQGTGYQDAFERVFMLPYNAREEMAAVMREEMGTAKSKAGI